LKYLLCAFLCAGCEGSDAFIGLSITLDGEIAPSDVDTIDTMEIEVTGAEETSRTYDPSVYFFQNRIERIRYWPGAKEGMLDFAITVRDADGVAVAYGEGQGTIDANGPTYVNILLAGSKSEEDLNVVYDLSMEAPPGGLPFPSHVTATFDQNAADCFAADIDTDKLQLDGSPPPAGVHFSVEGSVAILFCNKWNITQNVKIHGTRSLVVLASGPVSIGGVIDVSADHLTPGRPRRAAAVEALAPSVEKAARAIPTSPSAWAAQPTDRSTP
jgi:hypothetical protein